MKERLLALRPLLVRLIGYPVFFTFWFVVFVYVTFPYDRLKEFIVAQVEAPRRTPSGTVAPSNMQLSIGELGPTVLPGLHARNVALTFLPTKTGERATTMRMESVRARVGLFALLANTADATVDVQGMGGTVDSHVVAAMGGPRPGLRELRVRADNVRVGEIAPVVALVGLPLSGSLDTSVELRVPDGRVERASGRITLSADDLRVGDGRAQYQIPHFGGITIEQIRAGRLEGTVNVRDGVASVERLSARSDEFQLAIDGRVELRQMAGDSVVNLGVRFQLTDAYRRKSEQAGRIMMVMDAVPDLQAARRPDGMLAFRCRGTFDRGITCPPDARGGAGAGAGGSRFPGGFPMPTRRGFE